MSILRSWLLCFLLPTSPSSAKLKFEALIHRGQIVFHSGSILEHARTVVWKTKLCTKWTSAQNGPVHCSKWITAPKGSCTEWVTAQNGPLHTRVSASNQPVPLGYVILTVSSPITRLAPCKDVQLSISSLPSSAYRSSEGDLWCATLSIPNPTESSDCPTRNAWQTLSACNSLRSSGLDVWAVCLWNGPLAAMQTKPVRSGYINEEGIQRQADQQLEAGWSQFPHMSWG